MNIICINPATIFLLLLIHFLFLAPLNQAAANNTISRDQPLKDGDFLVSEDGIFELGFFSLGSSTSRYVGIKYHNLQDPAAIWVANRVAPVPDRNGVMGIDQDGNLVITGDVNTTFWTSNSSASIPSGSNMVATLDNTGNLVLSSNDSDGNQQIYWQSFNFPTDTFLPNMEVPINGEIHAFTSWASATDPSPGSYSTGLDARGSPQIVIWKGTTRLWRSGHWNNRYFIGMPTMAEATNYQFGFKILYDGEKKPFITYNPLNQGDLMRFLISYDGVEQQMKWNTSHWSLMNKEPADDCDRYNHCGNFGVCNQGLQSSKCRCPKGFKVKNPEQWNRGDTSAGCERSSPLKCQSNNGGSDGFKGIDRAKLPDFADLVNPKPQLDCSKTCLNNCSCNAYANAEGIGCLVWYGDLIDIQQFNKDIVVPGNNWNTLYLRVPASELETGLSPAATTSLIAAGMALLIAAIWLLWSLRRKCKARRRAALASRSKKSERSFSELSRTTDYSADVSGRRSDFLTEGGSVGGQELTMFNFATVAAATNNFSAENVLGQGGFGPVYKGKFPGQEIAVKRLSKVSGQGLEEFKNEVVLIARLQHRNLVKLLGCCIDGEEKLLLYEYMPNKSLDSVLFDPLKQAVLDWSKRFAIIQGIARGMVYLHRDSRLRIIHRDLKASNILLDDKMNPKISDFGMARIFGGNQDQDNTNRVVGTFGYMSPEYAMEGLISVKSDVYSFGVLLLEIVSGRKNTSFRTSDYVNLISYTWDLWNEDKMMDIVDPTIRASCIENEVLRCIQVAMLCVQDYAPHRPSMDTVVIMIEMENQVLPLPRQPTFTSMRSFTDTETFTGGQETVSSNNLTVTVVSGR